MNFAEAYKLPIGEYVEKKGKFAYLSWCYAVRFLRENYPDALWTIHENEHGLPIFSVGDSHLVKVSVTLDGKAFTQWHPILDNNNKPIKEPSTFHINTSIHRALTKAIGIATGIGLGLYAGEDLPKDEHDDRTPATQKIELVGTPEIAAMRDLLSMGKDYNEAKFCAEARIKSIEELPMARYRGAFAHAQKMIAEEGVAA